MRRLVLSCGCGMALGYGRRAEQVAGTGLALEIWQGGRVGVEAQMMLFVCTVVLLDLWREAVFRW